MATQKKKHNTALTSRLSWKECLSGGLVIKEKILVLKYLLKRERTNITRTLNMLVNQELIIVDKYDKCETTCRKVGYYTNKPTNL